ncbi:hypothetical protein [Sphingobium mellinum]|uniref:hypothetical protein n=1 Tax=Sphingobium mellinum TaxID=1387166 RepID=UPI0030EBCD7D
MRGGGLPDRRLSDLLSFRSILDKEAVRISTMLHSDIEAIWAQVRAMDFVHGTPQEVHQWRTDDAESRANLAIEDMALASLPLDRH